MKNCGPFHPSICDTLHDDIWHRWRFHRFTKTSHCKLMSGLNSGILRIFELSEFHIKLNDSDCRAWKIISNDTLIEPISWELLVENQNFNLRVGVWVGGQPSTNFKYFFKDAQENPTSFATHYSRGRRGKNSIVGNKKIAHRKPADFLSWNWTLWFD